MPRHTTHPGFTLSCRGMAAALLFALACAFACTAARAQESGQHPSWPKTIRFGINPWGAENEMRDMFRPLMDYIQEHLGVSVQIVIPTSYEDLLDRAAAGELDLMSFNSVTYLKARRRGLPLQYLATMERLYEGESQPRDSYIGYIIVHKDSLFKSLKDLQGHTFAFVEESSASGYKMPVAILGTQYNTTPKKFFKKFFFVGDHNEVMSAVFNHCVDGGATWDNSYAMNTTPDKLGNNFRIVARTPPIPNDAWVTGPAVPPDMHRAILDLLLSLGPDTRTAAGVLVIDQALGFPGSGWSKRGPEFYEDAADLLLYDQQ
jgi:phosphonate transport system substrate-binding protein